MMNDSSIYLAQANVKCAQVLIQRKEKDIMGRKQVLMIMFAAALVQLLAVVEGFSMQSEEKECGESLSELAACVTYVSGGALNPSAECCEDMERVQEKKPQCLCVLIKESSDPSLALNINTTLALGMPAACHSSANVSGCPSILKLSPGSPDAEIFERAGRDQATSSRPSASTPSAGSYSTVSGSSSKEATTSKGEVLLGSSLDVSFGAVSSFILILLLMFM